ncbi:hypothetical protein [Mycobacterium kyorinense]|uniref:Diacylglycerol O-acyltransferase n=1 Tax=Mycobacterium kyorinense TaxID=487514 RepID=A0A1X1YI57_9MYCO|nr:hypothetical protein [Mycobacterium kyorinense]ORW10797.1 hypothetical protein AWC14_19690 [Mycobacterium kyorinense]
MNPKDAYAARDVALRGNRTSNGDAPVDNRLALVDQALFAGHRATGLNLVIQCVWVYDHDVDLDGLKRFHHNLCYGLLGRRIELSPLPFGRPRWVVDRAPPDIEFAECARPRTELSDWADERSQHPIDAERGPGWHLGVLPLTDGSTAVSLVLSHYLVDGLGLALTIADAALGNTRELGYPPPCSRTRRRAVVQDVRHTMRDAPDVARAFFAAARLARKQARAQRGIARPPAPQPVALREAGEDVVVVPAVSIHVDSDEWDARAETLGGTGHTLVAGFAAKLAERLGRRRDGDGTVTLHLPINERTEGDTRANAMSIAIVGVDPTRVTTDLHDIRTAIKQALGTLRETPDASLQLRSLIPFTPKRALKRMVDAGFSDPDVPVLCSNLGDLGPLVCRLDGTDGELVMTRATGQHFTREWLERVGGQMTLQSWRTGSAKVYLTVNAYQPGAENTKPALRELAARTLAEFDLTGTIH